MKQATHNRTLEASGPHTAKRIENMTCLVQSPVGFLATDDYFEDPNYDNTYIIVDRLHEQTTASFLICSFFKKKIAEARKSRNSRLKYFLGFWMT